MIPALMTRAPDLWRDLEGQRLFSVYDAGVGSAYDIVAPAWPEAVLRSPYELLGIGTNEPNGLSMSIDNEVLTVNAPGFTQIQVFNTSLALWLGWPGPTASASPTAPGPVRHAYGMADRESPGIVYSGGTVKYGGGDKLFGHIQDLLNPPPQDSLNSLLTNTQIYFRINEAGHCVLRWDGIGISGSSGYYPDNFLTTANPLFLQLLGFDGSEVPTGTDANILTAANPLPGVWVPSRPIDVCFEGRGWYGEATRLHSGRVATATHSSRRLLELSAWLDGPADIKDLSRHFIDWWAPWAHPGSLITYWHSWTTRSGFSRWRINEKSSANLWARWPRMGALTLTPQRRAPINLDLVEAE